MPYGDGIPKINCYSLTDFHTFEFCPFKFFVTHHLDKKYELEEGSEQMALGSLLDQSIKLFHESKAYGCEADYLENLVHAASGRMKEKISGQKTPSFYSSIEQYLTEDLCQKATEIFKNYYYGKDKKIKTSIGNVGFCEWIISTDDGRKFKLWGGPDAYEMGDDGIPEVVDYKSRENIEKGKDNMDMELMPKIYTLLASKFLINKGFKKARFVVRFWQDPKEDGFYEEFNLSAINGEEFLFRQKIERILSTTEITFCDKDFCKACKSEKRSEFALELKKHGLVVLSAEEFMQKNSVEVELDKLFSIS